MCVPSLPIELVEKIVRSADRQQLGVLSCVSRTLQAITEPVLYDLVGDMGCRRTIHAMRSVLRAKRSYRRQYVRCFSINMSTWRQCHTSQLLRAFFRLLSDTLEVLPDLDSLHLIGLPPCEAWVLARCPAQPLAFVTSLPPSPSLSAWLQGQRRMEILVLANRYMAHWDRRVEVSSPALPNLRMICASSNSLQQLIPGRPVEHVVLDFTIDNKDANEYGEMKKTFALSSSPIHTFGIHFRIAPRNHYITSDLPMFISKDTEQLEDVTSLDIQVPTFDFFDALPELTNTVQTFPNLSALRVSGRRLATTWDVSALEEHSNNWRSHCPSLSRTLFRDSMEPETSHEFSWDGKDHKMVLQSSVGSGITLKWDQSTLSEYEYYSAMLQVALRG